MVGTISRGNPAYYEDGAWCDSADGIYIDGGTGIRVLRWTTRHAREEHRASFRAVTASMTLRPSTTSTCRTRGLTLTFRPPLPQTESIDFGGGVCHLYLRPGRASLLRYAEIAGRPRGPLAELAELAARVRARGDVSGVVLERSAASLAGRAADRLI